MKMLFLVGVLALFGCTKKATLDSGNEKETEYEQSIAEENDQCICTKEFRPVCGSDGTTYGNPCLAGCEGVLDFTEGECEKDQEE